MKTIFILAFFLSIARADWPQWRGPGAQGHAEGENVAVEWSETKNVTWKTALPGRGWSSPVIEGDRIWMTAAHETEASEEESKERLKANTGGQPVIVLAEVRFHAICLDKNSGEILHDIEVLSEKEPQWVHRFNSYASPSPVIENGRVYCHFGSSGTACVDSKSGEVVWRNQDPKLVAMHENGPGGSPVIAGDALFFHMDGSDKQFVAALDKGTGEIAWTTERSGALHENPQLKKAYGTPLVLEIDGKTQIVSPGANWLYGYDPAGGEELWRLEYGVLGFSNVARPVTSADGKMLYHCTGFMKSQMLAVRLGNGKDAEIAWEYKKGVPTSPSPVVVGDELYFVSDSGGLVTCLDAKSGDMIWSERIASGKYWSSPTYVDGKLYFSSEDGVTTVLKPGRECKVLAENTLEGRQFASLAVDGGAFFLRTDTALYRIEPKVN